MKKIIALSASFAALVLAPAAASAHHSFAMFDVAKTATVEGVVRSFEWTNPHSWINVAVLDASGQASDWRIEGQSPNELERRGWRRLTLQPGDKVLLVVHPRRDGMAGGMMVSASVNGTKIGVTPAG